MGNSTITLSPGDSLVVMAAAAPPTQPPLGIWGPGDPRPTLPIAGWDPIHGNWPTPPGGGGGGPPLGTWGPGDPRPTLPIAGWDPAHGTWPDRPPPVQPPPTDSGNWVWAWSPQAGRWVWVKVPAAGEPGPKTGAPTPEAKK